MFRLRLQLAEMLLLVALVAILVQFNLLVLASASTSGKLSTLQLAMRWVTLLVFAGWLAVWCCRAYRASKRAAPAAVESEWAAPVLLAFAACYYMACGLLLLSMYESYTTASPIDNLTVLAGGSFFLSIGMLPLLLRKSIRQRVFLWAASEALFVIAFLQLYWVLIETIASV